VEKNRSEDWLDEGANIWATRSAEPVGANLLGNADKTGWHLYCENGASAQHDGPEGRIECRSAGAQGSSIQYYTSAFPISQGKVYSLTFSAKCSTPFSLEAPTLMCASAPWTVYATSNAGGAFALGTEWGTYDTCYAAVQTTENARLTFFLGATLPAEASLFLKDVVFRECRTDGFLPNDVGNIIFDNGASCGVKVWDSKELDVQGEYWYDASQHIVKLYSVENPAKQYKDIECAIREHIIDQSNRHHVIYDGLALYYGAAHGIGGANTHHTITRNCDFAYIGGGDQMGRGKKVRFGNGIEFWATAHDHLVENCRLWEIYDAALTNQSGGPNTPQYNIIYRNNVIWNSEYSYEYWNRPEESETHDIRFEHNTCFNAGGGWGHAQRPDPSGRHLCFYDSPARARAVVIQGNIFCEALGNAFYAPQWSRAQIDALQMDRNCWYQSRGDMISIDAKQYSMTRFSDYQQTYSKEPLSKAALPLFVDEAQRDFRLSPGSPCLDAGAMTDTVLNTTRGPLLQGSGPDMGAAGRN
jgi:hypothetical protein